MLCPRSYSWIHDPSVPGGSAIFEGLGVLGGSLGIQEAERRGVEGPGEVSGSTVMHALFWHNRGALAHCWEARQWAGEVGLNGPAVLSQPMQEEGGLISMSAPGGPRSSEDSLPGPVITPLRSAVRAQHSASFAD